MIVPVKSAPSCKLKIVIIGKHAFLNAWINITLLSDSPFAFAVERNSWGSISKKLDLIILMRTAERDAPKVKAGKIILSIPSLPETGNQPVPIEKQIIKIGPSQKTGTLPPITAIKLDIISNQLPGLLADAIP